MTEIKTQNISELLKNIQFYLVNVKTVQEDVSLVIDGEWTQIFRTQRTGFWSDRSKTNDDQQYQERSPSFES